MLPNRFSFLFSLETIILAKVNSAKRNDNLLTKIVVSFGGDGETRTHYLYNANVALSQVSYAPTITAKIIIA